MIDNAILEYLKDNCTLTNQIYLGDISDEADYSAGVVRIQELPGSSTDNTTQKGYFLFQVSVFHTSHYEAGRIKNEIEALLIHYSTLEYGVITDDESNEYSVRFYLNGDLGEFKEERTVDDTAAEIWHKPFAAACSYINRFVTT